MRNHKKVMVSSSNAQAVTSYSLSTIAMQRSSKDWSGKGTDAPTLRQHDDFKFRTVARWRPNSAAEFAT